MPILAQPGSITLSSEMLTSSFSATLIPTAEARNRFYSVCAAQFGEPIIRP